MFFTLFLFENTWIWDKWPPEDFAEQGCFEFSGSVKLCDMSVQPTYHRVQ